VLTAAQLVDGLPHLMRFARSLTNNDRDAAEDLTQATALRAWERRALFADCTCARVWLFTVMRNVRLDGLRRKTKSPVVFDGGVADALRPVSPPAQEWVVAWRELPQVLSEDRLRLMVSYAQHAAYGSGRRGAGNHDVELARINGLPTGTVRSRVSRTKAAVREAYAR
jgi:RNA polymerase sigma-70 factor (ECF subfamily)